MPDDLSGRKFGRWTAEAFAFAKPPHRYYHCRCECGTERAVQANSLKSGTTQSCGCYRVEVNSEIHTTHNKSQHPVYKIWMAMHRRCYGEKTKGYRLYGGRGIKVCDRWRDFDGFWADMGDSWAPGLSIDRIDNDKGYNPENCRWATPFQQAQNTRRNLKIPTPWGVLTQSEAARRAGISIGCLVHRRKTGWPLKDWLLPVQWDPDEYGYSEP